MKISILLALTLLPVASLPPTTLENPGSFIASDSAELVASTAPISSVPPPSTSSPANSPANFFLPRSATYTSSSSLVAPQFSIDPPRRATHLLENDSGQAISGQQDPSVPELSLYPSPEQSGLQTPQLFSALSSPADNFRVEDGARGFTSSAAPIGIDDFDWPTSSKTVLRGFDRLEHNWLSGHRGVDLASRSGEKIRAAGPGRVVYSGLVVDNNVVSIEHSTGIRTTYMPVDPSVSIGDWVNTGDVIGTIEEGHCLLGTCLHWGAKRGDRYYDPLSLLDAVEIRLYPVSK